jgi:hypothetical protein
VLASWRQKINAKLLFCAELSGDADVTWLNDNESFQKLLSVF